MLALRLTDTAVLRVRELAFAAWRLCKACQYKCMQQAKPHARGWSMRAEEAGTAHGMGYRCKNW